MRRSDFRYHLPPELIAQHPLPARSASRLLELDGLDGRLRDRVFTDLPQLLRAGDLLVFNQTRVVPARLYARKSTGGRVELLLERVLAPRRALFQAHASKALRVDHQLELDGGGSARIAGHQGEFVELELSADVLTYLGRHGQIPLPPYIARAPDEADRERYQTVFARVEGAVAAPTAGLHFDAPLLAKLKTAGVTTAHVTLHVAAGTFQPLRVDDLEAHHMHSEMIAIDAVACEAIERTRRAGGRVVAVGTTVVRVLESVARKSPFAPFTGETDLFIHPGYRFRVVDALITNFHLPESTLLMLVCAFGGYAQVMAAYEHAVRERYRFFSYGDAMLVTPAREAA